MQVDIEKLKGEQDEADGFLIKVIKETKAKIDNKIKEYEVK
jgi:hypothetical protein